MFPSIFCVRSVNRSLPQGLLSVKDSSCSPNPCLPFCHGLNSQAVFHATLPLETNCCIWRNCTFLCANNFTWISGQSAQWCISLRVQLKYMNAMWPNRRDLDMEIMETRRPLGVGPWQMLTFLPRISLNLQIPRTRKFTPEDGIQMFFPTRSQRFVFVRHYSRILFWNQ